MTTREQIIAAAKLSEIVSANYRYDSTDEADWIDIERFYTIAFEAGRIAEREECALTVETESQDSTRYDFAQAIRARGDTK